MKKTSSLLLIILSCFYLSAGNPLYFCTAANTSYYPHLLNLIGSIHANNFAQLGEIAVFDLGLKPDEINHINRIQRVKVCKLEPGNPELTRVLRWFVWKPVVMKQALEMYPYMLYVDAGTTILKPIDHLFNYIENNQYFLGTIGNEWINGAWRHPISWGTTKFVRDWFKLDSPENKWVLSQEFVMGNMVGLTRAGFKQVMKQIYDFSKDVRYFQDDGTAPNGLGCGRHDQTLLSIWAYLNKFKIFKTDYTQNEAIQLPVEGKLVPLYITWNPDYVSQKTHIYHSRGDIKNSNHYRSRIRYI